MISSDFFCYSHQFLLSVKTIETSFLKKNVNLFYLSIVIKRLMF